MIESNGFLKFRADGVKIEIDLNTGSPGFTPTTDGVKIRLPGLQGYLLLNGDHLTHWAGALKVECQLAEGQGERLLEMLRG